MPAIRRVAALRNMNGGGHDGWLQRSRAPGVIGDYLRSDADALAAVREHLDGAASAQDPGSVQGEQALAEAGELAALADPAADLDAAYLLGMFAWFRSAAMGEDPGQDGPTAADCATPVLASSHGSGS